MTLLPWLHLTLLSPLFFSHGDDIHSRSLSVSTGVREADSGRRRPRAAHPQACAAQAWGRLLSLRKVPAPVQLPGCMAAAGHLFFSGELSSSSWISSWTWSRPAAQDAARSPSSCLAFPFPSRLAAASLIRALLHGMHGAAAACCARVGVEGHEGERVVLAWGRCRGVRRWKLATLPSGSTRSEKKRSLDPFLLPPFRLCVLCSHAAGEGRCRRARGGRRWRTSGAGGASRWRGACCATERQPWLRRACSSKRKAGVFPGSGSKGGGGPFSRGPGERQRAWGGAARAWRRSVSGTC
jgi:hypothetical protein